MKPITDLRRMALQSAARQGKRYAWAIDGSKSTSRHHHIEIYDSENPEHPIAVVYSLGLKDAFIEFVESQEYQPGFWL